jgi:hypothetical protein
MARAGTHTLPFEELMKDFANYMRNERGLSEVTIRGRCWHAGKFLDEFIGQNRPFAEVSVRDVDAFLNRKGSQGWRRVSVATSARALRSFFQHAEMRGWCEVGVATGIDGPRMFKQEALPVGPLWTDIQRLITSTTGDRPRDIRDQAILMLLAIYGFRSREVAGLRLEQMNWEREILGVLRPKQTAGTGIPTGAKCGRGDTPISSTGTTTLRSSGDLSNFEGAISPALARRFIPFGKQPITGPRNQESTSWSPFPPARLCRTSCGGEILAQGSWGSSRTPQCLCYPHLCQGRPGWVARGGELRSRRSLMKLSETVNQYVIHKQQKRTWK